MKCARTSSSRRQLVFMCAGVVAAGASCTGSNEATFVGTFAAKPTPPPTANPPPLSSVPVPQPAGGDVVNQAAAVRLGKALFWDVQQGGDGQTSCASCHFQAGTDNRRLNTMHPGVNGTFDSGGVTGP